MDNIEFPVNCLTSESQKKKSLRDFFRQNQCLWSNFVGMKKRRRGNELFDSEKERFKTLENQRFELMMFDKEILQNNDFVTSWRD